MKYYYYYFLIITLAFFVTTDSFGQKRKNAVRRYEKQKRVKTVKKVRRSKAVHYNYATLPRRGAVITHLPNNAIAYHHNKIRYSYAAGVWYRSNGRNWVVAPPVYGFRVNTLPVGYQRINVRNKAYYYYYGTYYQKRNNGYVVVEGPKDAQVDSIPKGYTTVTVNGEEFYELDGEYYMASTNDKGEEVLVVVPEPSYKN
ncbi:DUF6515 family protein [Flammeovirga aprica]|uniref:Uncharacterized protein n=1 Tax=Flammeovirga aprica JL-4 TaxID=694437 RepID=A0A7X9P0Z0_9BACT|nr:DUF6515 family protein [Flammeovirga aprica]NME67508.1 hypothetical protein [Flammeovirga aprica JL-4]